MSDATEDNPDNPPVWRSPCSCTLTAHEACLLDWVADLENPKNKQKASGQILCPQCKSEIKISRPKSYVVESYRAVDRTLGKLVLPGIGASLLTTIWAGAWLHGFYSIYLTFGYHDAAKIFQRASRRPEYVWMYSLIPVNLILSRTDYADFALPGSSLFLLSTQIGDNFEIDTTIWPPLPSTVFACLPAVRSIYNWCYHKTFCDLNKKWLQEVQPRHAQRGESELENGDNDQNLPEEPEEGHLVFEIEVNPNGGDDEMGGDEQEAGGNEDGQQAQPENRHVHQFIGRGDRLIEGSSSIGQTILGALSFPAVAAGMGNLLSYFLPSSWLGSANYVNGRPGLLRTKWGRSVIGGCLFVVLKDALVLYCRWRLAHGHRQRRIMNYDKKTKKYSV